MLSCYDVVVVILMASLRKRLGQGREGGGGRRGFPAKEAFSRERRGVASACVEVCVEVSKVLFKLK